MSDDKLKQKHVFVKNNVGSLALHKAKQEIGGIKMVKCEGCYKRIKKKDKVEFEMYVTFNNSIEGTQISRDYCGTCYNIIIEDINKAILRGRNKA